MHESVNNPTGASVLDHITDLARTDARDLYERDLHEPYEDIADTLTINASNGVLAATLAERPSLGLRDGAVDFNGDYPEGADAFDIIRANLYDFLIGVIHDETNRLEAEAARAEGAPS